MPKKDILSDLFISGQLCVSGDTSVNSLSGTIIRGIELYGRNLFYDNEDTDERYTLSGSVTGGGDSNLLAGSGLISNSTDYHVQVGSGLYLQDNLVGVDLSNIALSGNYQISGEYLTQPEGEVLFAASGALYESAADDRYLKLDATNDPVTGELVVSGSLVVSGNITLTGELQGSRQSLRFEHMSNFSTTIYINAGTNTSSSNGIVATRPGHIIGIGVVAETVLGAVGASVTYLPYKNNVSLITPTVTLDGASTGTKSGYQTAERGDSVSFDAGDILHVRAMINTGGATYQNAICVLEVAYDT